MVLCVFAEALFSARTLLVLCGCLYTSTSKMHCIVIWPAVTDCRYKFLLQTVLNSGLL